VADLFAGIGPFSITIAKRASPSAVYAVDINPAAIDYLKRNIKLNHVTGVVPMLGDIRNVAGKLPKADRLIMNLPHSAFDFLQVALGMARPGATVHFYDIIEPDKRAVRKEELASVVAREGRKPSAITCRLVRGYSTFESHFVFDITLD